MDVFRAFPGAVVFNTWRIGKCQRGSIVGDVFDLETAVSLDVIVDDGNGTNIDSAPNAARLDADLLIYAQPAQLPTVDTGVLVAEYMLYDGHYYDIVDASVGKNQETGEIEHIELLVKQTKAVK